MSAPRKAFSELVAQTDTCWLWTGARTVKGYPVYRGRYAHRTAVEYATGQTIPAGMQVDHLCHVLHCVNPLHLQVVTNRENAENRAGAYRSSQSGVRGVSWHRRAGKWIVQVTSGGVLYYGGLFDDITAAEATAVALRNELMTNNTLDRKALR